jgi:hypothetical protein
MRILPTIKTNAGEAHASSIIRNSDAQRCPRQNLKSCVCTWNFD